MPSQSNEAHVRISIPLIRYLQREFLTALEYNIVLYIIEHSINFSSIKNGGTPLWVEISPSRFAEDFGHSRVSVSRALSRLEYLGIFEVVSLKKLGQEYRNFRVVGREALNKALSDIDHINSKKPNRKKPETVTASLQGEDENMSKNEADLVASLLQSKVEKINNNSFDCSAHVYKLVSMRATAMYRCALRPCINARYSHEKITDKFQDLSDFQECIKNFKEYFKNVSTFLPPSYYDLVALATKTRRQRRDLEIALKRSIDRYSLFSVWVAMNVHLSSKELHFGNFGVLEDILKFHKNELEEMWNTVMSQVDNLFHELRQYEIECDSRMLNFETQAQVFLTSKRTEKKSMIFFFDSFEESVLYALVVSNGDLNSFREKVIKKINLYFKSKIYGERELAYEQVREAFMKGEV